ncbi:MAG: triosephosphate isomerase, partial [Bacteroidales bacterium]|nr:triosephosphate isomerase [Bacteroidales bacterium]
ETSETLVAKIGLALANGLKPIYCVGEKLEEREAGNHFAVVKAQLEEVLFGLTAEQMSQIVIAYEPVWAIGTGVTATSAQAQEIHAYIREVLAAKFGALAEEITILYGGSCKPSNAAELFACPDIDGGLIGGAALKADDFIAIAKSY